VLSRSRDLPIVGRFLSVEFDSQSPANLTGFADPEFNDLLSRARTTADPDRRGELYESAETRVCEQMPAVPLWSGVSHWVYESDGFNLGSPSVDANGNVVLRHVRKR
jgi:ABC-type transport system substrate-binding protein